MQRFAEDLRYGCRMLLSRPGFTVVAVLTLAVAIGACSTIFSAVNAVLLRRLPYGGPDRLVLLWGEQRQRNLLRDQVCFPDVEEWLRENQVFEDVAAYTGAWTPVLSGPSGAEQLGGARVSDRFFSVMRTHAFIGRTFLPGEQFELGGDVAVLSYGLWERSFGKDPAVVGSKINLDSKPYIVIGVLPREFRSLPVRLVHRPSEIYRPLSREFADEIRNGRHLRAIARLKPGVTLDQARQDMNIVARRLELAYPEENQGHGVRVVGMQDDLVEGIKPALLILQACVLLTLLIACANVANLLLAQSSVRRREMAIRQALGANRQRLVRQKLTESLLLAFVGGAAGLLLAFWCVPVVQNLGAKSIPELAQVDIDWRVVAFSALLSLVAGILFGLVPAFEFSAVSPASVLGGAMRGAAASLSSRGGRRALVIAETAVALMLLVCAGLLINSFVRLRRVDPGFDPGNTLAIELPMPGARFPTSAGQVALIDKVLERVGQIPGVASSAVVSVLPETSDFDRARLSIAGRAFTPATQPSPDRYEVSPGYFRTMSIPLLRGRLFAESDDAGHPAVVLINQTAAARLWPGEDPIGRQVRAGGADSAWLTIVGVVGDVHQYGLDSPKTLQIYLPYRQKPVAGVNLLVRGYQDPRPLTASIRAAIASVDRELPVSSVTTMDQVLADSVAGRRFSMILLAALGASAIMLASIGIYGVTAYSVAQRTAEFGVRMALGAQERSVIAMVLQQNFTWIAAGTAIGIVLAAALTRFLSSLLFGVSPYDPVTFVVASLSLALVALLASYVPARRATHVDPMTALRSQ